MDAAVSHIGKADRDDRSRASQLAPAAALGGGGALATGGLVAGGVPGHKVKRESMFERKPTLAGKMRQNLDIGGGAIFGYRSSAHEDFIDRVNRSKAASQAQSTGPGDLKAAARVADADNTIAAEQKVLDQMKRWRKKSHVALGAGSALAAAGGGKIAYDAAKRRREKVGKALSESARRRENALAGGTAVAGTVGTGAALMKPAFDREAKVWADDVKASEAKQKKASPKAYEFEREVRAKGGRMKEPVGLAQDKSVYTDNVKRIFPSGTSPETVAEYSGARARARQGRYFNKVWGQHGKIASGMALGAGALTAAGAAGVVGNRLHDKKKNGRKS